MKETPPPVHSWGGLSFATYLPLICHLNLFHRIKGITKLYAKY